jgi:hypothetical protein
MKNKRAGVAIVRQYIERIEGVSRTWFEWTLEETWLKTLVIEVEFDTDPNSPDFDQAVLDAIKTTARDVLVNETTMAVHHLRVVPRRA